MSQGKANDTASEEEIILAESEIEINGELVTVKEITYMQGMKLHSRIQPLLDDMASAFTEEATDFSLMEGVFSQNIDVVNELITLTTGKDTDWLVALNDTEGQMLLMTFWLVNTGFFTRRVVGKAMHKMQQQAQKEAQGSESNTERS